MKEILNNQLRNINSMKLNNLINMESVQNNLELGLKGRTIIRAKNVLLKKKLYQGDLMRINQDVVKKTELR